VRWLVRGVVRLAGAFVLASVALVALLRFVDPPFTSLMGIRAAEAALAGRHVVVRRRWVGLDAVSPALIRSVIASEDARFFTHWGIDVEAARQAAAYNARHRGRRLRGASTITMQCARSVFLWPARSWPRKVMETYFALLLETLWGKRRILEVYLNVAEWGDGVYGVEAAAELYFGVPAARLDARTAALLAAALPSPRRSNPSAPSAGLAARAAAIEARAVGVRLEPLAERAALAREPERLLRSRAP